MQLRGIAFNKTRLIDVVASKAGLTKRDARIAVTVVPEEMQKGAG